MMKWTYSIQNKVLASSVLFALCLLVLLSNYLDRKHTTQVKNAIATLYEDRLIAEGYILKMTRHMYEIREVLHAEQAMALKAQSIDQEVNAFHETYDIYMKTKLTTTEEASAISLIGHVNRLHQRIDNNPFEAVGDTEKALASLAKLSAVQLNESKLIMNSVESEYANIKASSQFAFAIIIIILVVLQAIVFSTKSLLPPNLPQDPSMN